MTRIYYRNAQAAIICFDLTSKATFDKVREWVDELLSNEKECSMYVVGTKADLVQENPESLAVDAAITKNFASNISAQYFETSAKSKLNVDSLFEKITDDYLQKIKNLAPPPTVPDAILVTPPMKTPPMKDGSCTC
eukprot:TRINITY_DN1480_c0_g1_i4.p2 TRINITY_DN1480_c0_g1~~TRINITY_DN1480_c0_g1_i4.p2  ORF type:complete len:136 (+),score=26.25 TRINITY_DN1480_c0_g1_i4:203-610(+)